MAVTDTENLSFKHGALTFSAQAMGDGPIVLCLHGFPDNAGSYRHQLPALAEAGYRAISLTLRGYEPDSFPADGDYTMETIATDILAVIESLDIGPVHLVGHDWGAAVAYVAAAAAPERFKSLTVMACYPTRAALPGRACGSSGNCSCPGTWAFLQYSLALDWVVQRQDYAFIRKLWRDWSPRLATGTGHAERRDTDLVATRCALGCIGPLPRRTVNQSATGERRGGSL